MTVYPRRVAARLAVVAVVAGGTAQAQEGVRITPSIDALLTATNNSAVGAATEGRSDLVLELRPRLDFSGRSARLRLNGSLGLQAIAFVDNGQSSEIYPECRLDANLTFVERWLFLDTAVAASHPPFDAFSLQSGSIASAEGGTVYRYRLSPYVYRELSPRTVLQARSENNWAHRSADPDLGVAASRTSTRRNSFSLETRPEPLGGAVEAYDEDSTSNTGEDTLLASRGARLVLSYAPTPYVSFGISGGRERSELNDTADSSGIYGWRLRWVPNERTSFEADAEKRFFGWGANTRFTLRSPFVSLSLVASRQPAVSASPLLDATQGVTAALDAAFTTRYPDPVQRATVVQNFINAFGVPTSATGAIDVFPAYAQLQNRGSATLVFIGRLTTVSLGIFAERSTLLLRENSQFLPTVATAQDARQLGGSIDFARRLSPQLTANASVAGRQIVGLNDAAGQYARETTVIAGARYTLSPRTSVNAGLRFRLYRSNVNPDTRESAAFVGANHRF